MNINKTVHQTKWIIENDELLVEFWQQREYCIMQDMQYHSRADKEKAVLDVKGEWMG